MRENSVLGIVFSNMHDEMISELTRNRTMGSVPFGGRYRLIDFALSNMVNSGITKVGVITKSNYQSLMDHLGSGKSWDLSRKRDGLFILPPFGAGQGIYNSRIDALYGISSFIKRSSEEYVFMTDCDTICNIDIHKIVENHQENKADVTVVYKNGKLSDNMKDTMVLKLDKNNRVYDIDIDPDFNPQEECSFAMNMFVMKKNYLERLIAEAFSRGSKSFIRDVLQSNAERANIIGYGIESYVGIIDSLNTYFDVNMQLLNKEAREHLFPANRPVYTKIRDDMPSKYGLNAAVKNSFVADGCIIEGEVINSILFKGVHIGKGTKVSNSVIIQQTYIGDDCRLSNIITDKNVLIKNGRTLIGYDTYPVFIEKNRVI
jgi:glucose-1-phosphate adenylyltransferase, GlgD subunit